MKKRSCRMTANEKAIHERAVKLRKMTDEQLCNYVDNGNSEDKPATIGIDEFLTEAEGVKGVGLRTIQRLRDFATEQGYITEG